MDAINYILIISSKRNELVQGLAKYASSSVPVDYFEYSTGCLYSSTGEQKLLFRRFFGKIPFLCSIELRILLPIWIFLLSRRYSLLHFCYVHQILRYCFPILFFRKIRYICSVFGSDFSSVSDRKKINLKSFFDKSLAIIFTNNELEHQFNTFFEHKYENKTITLRLGLNILDKIAELQRYFCRKNAKKQLGFLSSDYIVACGTNASPNQNHEKVIASLSKQSWPENYLFLFFMTYGDRAYLRFIEQILIKSGIRYHIFDQYLSSEKLALSRIASDVLIQVQTNDQLSGAMQEQLFAGGAVITGSWLPYRVFDREGIVMTKIHNIDDINDYISEPISQESVMINRQVIYNLSSWEKCSHSWIKLYQEILLSSGHCDNEI